MTMLLAASSCGSNDDEDNVPRPDASPCVPGTTEIAVTGPSAYQCRESFEATVMFTNRSCATLTVQEVRITAAVTSGVCAPAGPGTYTPAVTSVAHSRTATVLDLTGGFFCCLSPGCPLSLQCDERFDVAVVTSGGTFNGSTSAHLDLDGCDVVCTP